jgi:hypothetical protein
MFNKNSEFGYFASNKMILDLAKIMMEIFASKEKS